MKIAKTGRRVLLAALLAIAVPHIQAADTLEAPSDQTALNRHIREAMPLSVCEATSTENGNFALPKPYSVPCTSGGFRNMFYWDTYFTNAGLLLDGDFGQALNNIEDIAYMIDSVGYMPNATARDLLNRSQPPLFCQMVKDYFDATGDKAFLQRMIPLLEKECTFWMTHRIAPNGLNRYGHDATRQELTDFCNGLAHRVRVNPSDYTDDERIRFGAHLLAEAESGWDFTPRFEGRCMDFNPVDLNAILYGFERNMAEFNDVLGRKGNRLWNERAEKRKALINRYMLDPTTGLYFDYDYVNGKRSDVYSAAVFTTLWAGVADEVAADALLKSLDRLEAPCGVLTCAFREGTVPFAQWDAPNGWAPLHYFAIKGLDRYGFRDAAGRIAAKYLAAQTSIYGLTHQLWEKYNAVKGNTDVNDEYKMPGEFLGWTAGVYQTTFDYLYGRGAGHSESKASKP